MSEVKTDEDALLERLIKATLDKRIPWLASVKLNEFIAFLSERWRLTVGLAKNQGYWVEIADKSNGRILFLKWASLAEISCEPLDHPIKKLFWAVGENNSALNEEIDEILKALAED